MKLIYISGKYRGKNAWEIYNNILHAERAAHKLWSEGWAVICPHKNTCNLDGELTHERFIEGDCEMVRRSDAIFMLKDWESSEGAKIELRAATESGLEIIYE